MKEKLKYNGCFIIDRCGSTAVEFAIVSMIFIGLSLGVLDMSVLAWKMNSAKAAARVGVRYLVVNKPISIGLQNYDAIKAKSVSGNGEVVPTAGFPVLSCSAKDDGSNMKCTSSSSAITDDSADSVVYEDLRDLMRRYYGPIGYSNINVSYQHVGLGVAGNPCAPDVEPLVTVSLGGLTYSPIALRVFGSPTFVIPSVRSSMTGESLGRTSC